MQSLLDKLGTNIYVNGNHYGYKINWSLISPICNKWSRNRDCDENRVKDMLEYHKKGGYIPWLLHLADIKQEGLVCYDGNHRRELLNILQNDQECIIDVLFNTTTKEVYTCFDSINQSVQVPALYFESNESDIKHDIVNLVRKYEHKYPNCISTSSRCHAPHFNRDSFSDAIYNLYSNYNGKISIEKIEEALDKLNTYYSNGLMCKPHTEYKTHIIEKCKKTGLWLFINRTLQPEHLERLLN